MLSPEEKSFETDHRGERGLGDLIQLPLSPSQSISSAETEKVVSLCVHIAPRSDIATNETTISFDPHAYYGLTTCNVIVDTPMETNKIKSRTAVVTPGALDKLALIWRESNKLGRKGATLLLEEALNWDGVVRTAVCGELGTDGDGWRKDWALIELSGEYNSHNDIWYWAEDPCKKGGKSAKNCLYLHGLPLLGIQLVEKQCLRRAPGPGARLEK